MPEVRRHPQSRADVLQIWLYIAQDSHSAADRLIDRIEEVIQRLAENPMMGQSWEEASPSLRSFPVRSYRIFYRPVEDGIEIVRVLHAARDIGPLLENIDDI